MPPGPILIFDKSFLQSLNVDEAVWLDNFFLTAITPLFFVETLADLEKEVHGGRSRAGGRRSCAEDAGPPMAYGYASRNPSLGGAERPEDPHGGRIPRAGGQLVELDGKQGVIYERSKEEEAFDRWQRGQFLDLERQIAKVWETQRHEH